MHINQIVHLRVQIKRAFDLSSRGGRIKFSDKAKALWVRKYQKLTADMPGLLGAVTSRSEAQVLRLSLVYALLDRSVQIKTQHVRAALAVWRYCRDSAQYIFGDATGNPVADKILAALRGSPNGLSRTDIRGIFSRNRSEAEISRALATLAENRLVRCQQEVTGGRPRKRWFAL